MSMNQPEESGFMERARGVVAKGVNAVDAVSGKARIAAIVIIAAAGVAGCTPGKGAYMGGGDCVTDCGDTGVDTGVAKAGKTECNDGIDNDGAGGVDGGDQTCASGGDDVEGGPCADGYDNDESDGWTDWEDPKCWSDPNDPGTYDPRDMCETLYGSQESITDCPDEPMRVGDEGFLREVE